MNNEFGGSVGSKGLGSRNTKIEFLRFSAATSVLIWHYQHFYDSMTNFDKSTQPLYEQLGFFYDYGLYAVQLFWIISGFVFSTVYGNKLHSRKVSVKKFFWKRFARLYPLHLLTLLLVSLIQFVYLRKEGTFFVYEANTPVNFLKQIVMASNWMPGSSFSFNGPIWSVSVEILVYAFFATYVVIFKPGLSSYSILTAVSMVLTTFGPSSSALDALALFMMGCVIGQLSGKLLSLSLIKKVFIFLGLVILVALAVGVRMWFLPIQKESLGPAFLAVILGSSLCIISLLPDFVGSTRQLFDRLGSISYGMYLWHFPIQLGIVLTFGQEKITRLSSSPFFLFIFLAIVLATSFASKKYIEDPCRIWLLTRFESART